MIEKIIPGTKMKLNAIRIIYKEPEINLTSLIKKLRASPNAVLDYINGLEFFNIIQKSKEDKKKAPVRNLKINFDSPLSILFLALTELDQRLNIIKKYPRLQTLFEQIERAAGTENAFGLLYGSYARMAAEKTSDIDIIIVGEKLKKDRLREVLITFPEASLKTETKRQFLSNLKKPLYQNILREHVVVFNEIGFLKTIKSHIVAFLNL